MEDEEDLLCLTITAYKRPGMDFDDYVKYMQEVHTPLVSEQMEKHGILEYTQVSGLLSKLPARRAIPSTGGLCFCPPIEGIM